MIQLSRGLLNEIVDSLARAGCQFWACEGPTLEPIDMKTCHRCETLAKVQGLTQRADREPV